MSQTTEIRPPESQFELLVCFHPVAVDEGEDDGDKEDDGDGDGDDHGDQEVHPGNLVPRLPLVLKEGKGAKSTAVAGGVGEVGLHGGAEVRVPLLTLRLPKDTSCLPSPTAMLQGDGQGLPDYLTSTKGQVNHLRGDQLTTWGTCQLLHVLQAEEDQHGSLCLHVLHQHQGGNLYGVRVVSPGRGGKGGHTRKVGSVDVPEADPPHRQQHVGAGH